jgi:hypothetical protein
MKVFYLLGLFCLGFHNGICSSSIFVSQRCADDNLVGKNNSELFLHKRLNDSDSRLEHLSIDPIIFNN